MSSMTPIAKPTIANTQFKLVQKPTVQAVPPFETIKLRPTIQTAPTTQPIATPTKLLSPPPTPPTPPTMTEYLPLLGLVIIGGFIMSRN